VIRSTQWQEALDPAELPLESCAPPARLWKAMPARAVGAPHLGAIHIRESCAELQKMGSGWRTECSAFPLSSV
jgi:hypothetical protein